MELAEERAAPHTKTGHVIYVTGEHLTFHVMVAIPSSWTAFAFQAVQKSPVILILTPNKSDRLAIG